MKWPENLVREIADRRAIIFVGAGISKYASPSLPTWPNLITTLGEKLETKVERSIILKLIKSNQLLDAAQIIFDSGDRAEINTTLNQKFSVRPTPFNEIYKTLLNLDLKTICTTNYDDFLERNFDHYSGGNQAYSVLTHKSSDILDKVRSPQRIICKIHGCIHHVGDIVLERQSYFDSRRRNVGFYNALSALFLTNTILFIGYSLGDPDLQILLENSNSSTICQHGHYALLPKLEHKSIRNSIKHSYNVNCIEYDKNDHSVIGGYLTELNEMVQAVRATHG